MKSGEIEDDRNLFGSGRRREQEVKKDEGEAGREGETEREKEEKTLACVLAV